MRLVSINTYDCVVEIDEKEYHCEFSVVCGEEVVINIDGCDKDLSEQEEFILCGLIYDEGPVLTWESDSELEMGDVYYEEYRLR